MALFPEVSWWKVFRSNATESERGERSIQSCKVKLKAEKSERKIQSYKVKLKAKRGENKLQV